MRIFWISSALIMALAGSSAANESGGTASALVHAVSADGSTRKVGTVHFEDSKYGLIVAPDLNGLAAGQHAAHVHENPDCGSDRQGEQSPAAAAGGHYDPGNSGEHRGPYAEGHLGDLPNLYVDEDGTATIPVLAPRATAADVRRRALIIHAGADHYQDHAEHSHGTGGARVYCGVIR